jgi:hypothetical protein
MLMDMKNTDRKIDIYDASEEQIHYWNNPGNSKEPEVISFEFTLENLEIDLIEKTIEILIRRHESLRTFFKLIDGKVKQCVLAYSKDTFAPRYYDICSEKDIPKVIKRINKAHSISLNNLSTPPLVNCSIFRISDNSHLISLMIHHIICDGWSKRLLQNELSNIYLSLKNGAEVEVGQHVMQLRDYVAWQKKWLIENGEAAHQYWTGKFRGPNSELLYESSFVRNTISPKPSNQNKNSSPGDIKEDRHNRWEKVKTGYINYHIKGAEYTQLTGFSKSCGASSFAVLYSSIQLLFFILAGKEKILISTPFANRFIGGTESIIGCLVGTIYLHREINEKLSIKEFITEGYIDFLEACNYPIYNHDSLLSNKELRIHPDLFMNFMGKELSMRKTLSAQPEKGYYVETKVEFFELVYTINEYEDGLSCNWRHNRSLYPLPLVSNIISVHKEILTLMLERPEITISELKELVNA